MVSCSAVRARRTSGPILLSLLICGHAQAADIVWASAGFSTWTAGGSWVAGNVPAQTDTVGFKGWAPLARTNWVVTASVATYMGHTASLIADGRRSTYWTSGTPQVNTMNVQIDLASTQTFAGIDMVDVLNGTEYPRSYDVFVSSDGTNWGSAVYSDPSGSVSDTMRFSDQTARYIKIQLNSGVANSWTISELTVWGTAGGTMLAMGGMTASVSPTGTGAASNMTDFNNTTSWTSVANQVNGQWVKLDLGTTDHAFTAVSLDAYSSTGDYPITYNVEVATSAAPNTWTSVATGSPSGEFVYIPFTQQTARYVRVTQTGSSVTDPWTVYEFHVFGTPNSATTPASLILAGINQTTGVTFIQASGHTITLTGDWKQSGGTFTGGNSLISIGGDFNQSGGTHTATSGTTQVSGAFNQTAGSFTQSSGTVLLDATGAENLVTNTASFFNLAINDGLVGYWKLDEAATPSVDSSGWGRNGVWSGGGIGSSPIVPALNFTDSNSLTVAQGTGDAVTFTPTPLVSAVTVAAWVYSTNRTSGGGFPRILNMPVYQLSIADGAQATRNAVAWTATAATSGQYSYRTLADTFNDLTVYHIAASMDAAGTGKVWINGVSVHVDLSGAGSGGISPTANSGSGYIGNNGGGSGTRPWNGRIDDLRIYNRVLDDSEVYSLYAGNQPGTGSAVQTLSGTPTVSNDLILASGTLLVGSGNLTVSGSWNNYGGLFTAGSSTVTLNATTGEVIRSAGQPFKNLTLSGSGATWTLEDWLKVDGALTMTTGALSAGAYAVHASNLNRSAGTLSSTGTVVIDTTADVFQSTGFSFNNLRVETPDETGLVGYWKFDEGQGTTIRDSSGTNNHGVLFGNTSWTDSLPPVTFDNHAALRMNGSTDYATVGTTLMPANNASQTISAWVNFSNTTGGDYYIVSMWNPAGAGSGTSIGIKSSGLAAWKWGGTALASLTAPATGSWHHVAYTFDFPTTTHKLYLDSGMPNISTTAPNTLTPTNVQIGTYNGGFLHNGLIDDVRIYSVALTAAQIANLLAGGYAGTGSDTTVTLGANLTVNKTLAIDNGTLDTDAFTVNAGATDSTQTATVNAGTLKVGSSTVTFNGGLTVGKQGTVTEDTANGKIAVGTGEVLEYDEPAGAVVGFPTAAFDWSSFAFWRQYVAFSSYIGATTADTVLALTANGGTKYSWQLPSGKGSLLGTPRWNTEVVAMVTSHYIYLITTTGWVYKVTDTGSALTALGSPWPYQHGASATATSPLGNDGSNLYWSGFASGGMTPKIFSLTLAGVLNGTGLTITSNVGAAPALATISGTPYVFFAISGMVYQETLTLGSQWTSTHPTSAVNGRISFLGNNLYFPENNGTIQALTAISTAGPTTVVGGSWPYQDRTSSGHTGAGCTMGTHVCPVVSNIYVDIGKSRICFGDADGHIYVLNSGGTVLHAGFPARIAVGDVISVAPVSRNGVLLVAATNGTNYKVYEIDETNGSTMILTRTYVLPAAVSSISFNPSANAGNGAYTVGTADGKLFYIGAGTDQSAPQ